MCERASVKSVCGCMCVKLNNKKIARHSNVLSSGQSSHSKYFLLARRFCNEMMNALQKQS